MTKQLPRTVRFGAHKLPRPKDFETERIHQRSIDMLARCLNLRTTVAVVGSGFSIPLGYPSWKKFAGELLDETLAILPESNPTRGHISGMRDHFVKVSSARGATGGSTQRRPKIDAGTLMYFVGVCKRAILGTEEFDQADEARREQFSQLIDKFFGPEDKEPLSELNPYEALLELPIRRFVTTNYDREIEAAIRSDRQGLRSCETLTQSDANTEALTGFALEVVPKEKYTVFHCHGDYVDASSIIAGESDYQRLYLSRDTAEGAAFRHSIELLFESNPLLFVGYGLGDEDLLRPLRVLGAVDRTRKSSRPIFALMPKKSDDDDYQLFHYYERYGLHVIPYTKPEKQGDGQDANRHTERVCEALWEIRDQWLDAQDEWHKKPPPRRVAATRDQTGKLPPTNWLYEEGVKVPIQAAETELNKLKSILLGKPLPSVLGFLGPSGCGKTRQIRRLMSQLRARKRGPFPSGFFYWNAHYVNEGMTGIDQLLDFLDPQGRHEGARVDRLAKTLRDRKGLVIIDGAERLFRPTSEPLIGEPISGYVERLLDVFADSRNSSTVVLVGRLWPRSYEDIARTKNFETFHCRRVHASQVHTEDVENFLETSGHSELLEYGPRRTRERLSALCSLLRGHNFGLLLAVEWVHHGIDRLKSGGDEIPLDEEVEELFKSLERRLAKARINRRLTKIIRISLEDLDERTCGLASPFIEQLGFSLNAVSETTLRLIYDKVKQKVRQAAADHDRKGEFDPLEYESFIKLLSDRHLILGMPRIHEAGDDRSKKNGKGNKKGGNGEEVDTFAVHSKVRGYFHRAVGLPEDYMPSLKLGGITTGDHGVDPGTKDGPALARLLIELIERGEVALANGDRKEACDLCRDAYSMIRSRMEASTAPRWKDYSEYSRYGIRLVQLAKAIGDDQQWSHRDSPDQRELEDWRGALFLAEMVWVYNDLGLALYCEGLVADAYSVWEQAFDIARMIEQDSVRGGVIQIQILINMSYSLLEQGRLLSAKEYIYKAEGMNKSIGDRSLDASIQGCNGLLHHLNGNLRDAEACYDDAIDLLKGSEEIRGLSFFYKLRADLKMAQNQNDKAKADARAASILAEQGRFQDLVVEAKMSDGKIAAEKKDWADARLSYEIALRTARKIKSRRLEAAVLTNLARLALDQRDFAGARYHAMRSLKLANEFRLGLRVSHSLVILGLATLGAGRQELGVAYLKQARLLANQQQYWHRAREAELKLEELGRS